MIHVNVFVDDDHQVGTRHIVPEDSVDPYFVVCVGNCTLFASRANLERISAALIAALEEHE